MKLERFVNRIKAVQDKYGLNPMTLLVLDFVLTQEGEATIMKICEGFWRTTQVTTRKHIKALLDKKILKIHQIDGRSKELVRGAKFEELSKFIGE